MATSAAHGPSSRFPWCCWRAASVSAYTPDLPAERRDAGKFGGGPETRIITTMTYGSRGRGDSETSSTTTIYWEAPDARLGAAAGEPATARTGGGSLAPLPPPTLAPSSDFRTHEPGRPLSVVSEEGPLATDRTERSSMVSSSFASAGLLAFSRRMTADAAFETYTPPIDDDDAAGSRRGSGPLERVVPTGAGARAHGHPHFVVRSGGPASSARRGPSDASPLSALRPAPASSSDSTATDDAATPRVALGSCAAAAAAAAPAAVIVPVSDSTSADGADGSEGPAASAPQRGGGRGATEAAAASDGGGGGAEASSSGARARARRPLKRQGTGYVGGPPRGAAAAAASPSTPPEHTPRDKAPRDRGGRGVGAAPPFSGAGVRGPAEPRDASPRRDGGGREGGGVTQAAAAVWGRIASSLRPAAAVGSGGARDEGGGRAERVSPLRTAGAAAEATGGHAAGGGEGLHAADWGSDAAASHGASHVNPAFSHRLAT